MAHHAAGRLWALASCNRQIRRDKYRQSESVRTRGEAWERGDPRAFAKIVETKGKIEKTELAILRRDNLHTGESFKIPRIIRQERNTEFGGCCSNNGVG